MTKKYRLTDINLIFYTKQNKMTNRIKAHRRKRGISQSTLAYITSLGQSTISEIENNKYIPRVDTAIRIAQALNTTVERLFIIE